MQRYLNLDGPDDRFRDVELLLRFIAFELYSEKYKGNLKKFLDLVMRNCNEQWADLEQQVIRLNREFEETAEMADKLFSSPAHVGRKYTEKGWESRFNKAIFEVEMYFIHGLRRKIRDRKLPRSKVTSFPRNFESFCAKDSAFIRSVEVTTKSVEQYQVRYESFRKFIKKQFGVNVPSPDFRLD